MPLIRYTSTWAVVGWLSAPGLLLAAVDSADDVCSPVADPCVITQVVSVVDGATLDFGTRAVEIRTGGQIDTGAGSATVRCGKFSSEVGVNLGLKVRGATGSGTIDGGSLVLEAVRRCDESQSTTCIADSDCEFGSCTAQVCSLDPARRCAGDSSCFLGACGATVCSRDSGRLCESDAACDVGPCNLTTRRCTQESTVICFSDFHCTFGSCALDEPRCAGDPETSCATNSDCDRGVCDVDVCTQLMAGANRPCAGNSDCFDGVCSVGDGSIRLNGRSRADGAVPGSISVRAAGNIDVLQTVQLQATVRESDGGYLELESGTGAVHVNAAITAAGGGLSQGGSIDVTAGTDIAIDAPMDVTGGDFDGGYLYFLAGRDLLINQDLLASSTAGGGVGGEIDVTADRDIVIGGLAQLLTNGHTSIDNFGGDGGFQAYYAGRDLRVGATTRIEADGALPDGFGEEVYFESGGDMVLSGPVSARGRGDSGSGGVIETDTGGDFRTESTAILDVTGGSSGGGGVEFFATGTIDHDGVIDARATSGGIPDTVLVASDADVTMTGDVLLDGGPPGPARGDVDIEGCRIILASGASISNLGGGGRNTFTAHASVAVNLGASVVTAPDGTNWFRYRIADNPPAIAGVVSPASVDELVSTLTGCSVCGNFEIENRETCDDGNLVDGDGCNASCQHEGCIASTPGYPSTPLCDDENPCTVDACESSGCTYDTATGPCDDGLDCTENDTCDAGNCHGVDTCPDGQACSVELGVCAGDGDGCGDPTLDGRITASDALLVLNVAVGLQDCSPCLCDVDASTTVSASDSLKLLNVAVGIPGAALNCPAC